MIYATLRQTITHEWSEVAIDIDRFRTIAAEHGWVPEPDQDDEDFIDLAINRSGEVFDAVLAAFVHPTEANAQADDEDIESEADVWADEDEDEDQPVTLPAWR